MKKSDVIKMIFKNDVPLTPCFEKGIGYAPTNIALCKYWGKRDVEINLPVTSSLSIALLDRGAMTTLSVHDKKSDEIILNGKSVDEDSEFAKRLVSFLDLFRVKQPIFLRINIDMNLPVAAGLASSACGFASLISALNDLCQWNLPMRTLSILSRLGSGSAARSLWTGFVEWQAGVSSDGMDSYAVPLDMQWPALRVGILTFSAAVKPISSRVAMQRTIDTSVLYDAWPKKVSQDLSLIKQAIKLKNLPLLGGAAESNALSMHATMASAWPPISYTLPDTLAAERKVWELRDEGLDVYFTQDAGPNLKLLFLEKDTDHIKKHFGNVDIVKVFE